MSKARRFTTEQEIIHEIDRLKDEIPGLYKRADDAAKEFQTFKKQKIGDKNHLQLTEMILEEYKRLKRAAKRAASAPTRQEKKLKKMKDALSEFRTTRMPFLTDATVEVK